MSGVSQILAGVSAFVVAVCLGCTALSTAAAASTVRATQQAQVTSNSGRTIQIAAGHANTCDVDHSGSVRCWGWNFFGELGNGTLKSTTVPIGVGGLAGVRQVAIGFGHTCALLRAGTVECLGWNRYGQLGDARTVDTRHPVRVRGLTRVREITLGFEHSCALLVTRQVACWGWNFYGQLGDGGLHNASVPVVVKGLSGVVTVAAGYAHTCAVLLAGTVKCWGLNQYGQLGNGSTRSEKVPVTVRGIAGVTGLAVGFGDSCAILGSGATKCWGWNKYGQLGDDSRRDSNVPVAVRGLSGVIQLALGYGHSCALLVSHTVKCWGWNQFGALGTGTHRSSSVPMNVRLAGVIQLVAGDDHTCALLAIGPYTCWGSNISGQLGVGSTISDPQPPYTPFAPTGISAVARNGAALVRWHAPLISGLGAVKSYTATSHPGTLTCVTRYLACKVIGLSNGISYTFTVTASNVAGAGLASSPSTPVTPATKPDNPTLVTATRGNGAALVSWHAPSSNGGSKVLRYTATAADSTTPARGHELCRTAGPLSCIVSGLTNGDSYTFTVIATNAMGNSVSSTPSQVVVPASKPGPPTGVSATRGNTSALVSWSAPSSNGKNTITGYQVTAADSTTPANGHETCQWTTGPLSCTVSGLTNGDGYTFTVRATNSVGIGSPSSPSSAVVPATTPGPPTGVSATPGNTSALVSWSAPSSNGGSTITSYTVTAADSTTPANGHQTCKWTTGPLSCGNWSGLTNGDSYTFTVTATNSVGTGNPSSPSSAVVPATTPGPPTGVSATPGNTSSLVSWSAPGSNGGSTITGYTVTAADSTTPANGHEICQWTTGPLSCTVSGLTNGNSYTFTVTATSGTGTGPPSQPSAAVVPANTPGQPTGVSATPGDTTALVSWSAPGSNGGSTITGYTVTAADSTTPANGNETCPWTTGPLSCTVSGLTNGDSYTFTVTATNSVGAGSPSSPSSAVVPATTPGPPTGVSATPGVTSAIVTWSAPASDGGSTIIDYTATAADSTTPANGNETCPWNSGPLTCTVSGLTTGDSYTFTVTATNSVGTGSPSSSSSPIIAASVHLLAGGSNALNSEGTFATVGGDILNWSKTLLVASHMFNVPSGSGIDGTNRVGRRGVGHSLTGFSNL